MLTCKMIVYDRFMIDLLKPLWKTWLHVAHCEEFLQASKLMTGSSNIGSEETDYSIYYSSGIKGFVLYLYLGQEFQNQYKRLTFEYRRHGVELTIRGYNSPCTLSSTLVCNRFFFLIWKLIATKSQHFSKNDQIFIK